MYVLQARGSPENLTAEDIGYLRFASGHTCMGTDEQGQTCYADKISQNTIAACLNLPSSICPGDTYADTQSSNFGVFNYNPGHLENHAGE